MSWSDGLPVLLGYQQRWTDEADPVAVVEKGRRIGLSWADAARSVLYAAEGRGDVYYQSYNKDMTETYVTDCQEWGRRFHRALSEVIVEDVEVEGVRVLDRDGERQQRFRVRTESGRDIIALPSNPRSARSKGRPGDMLIIDEAAFCDELQELLTAALGITNWGGRVRIISTHAGDESPFNELVNDVRSGRLPYALHRITLDDAIADGLARRVCTVKGDAWTADYAARWRRELFARYADPEHANEELLCIPRRSSGVWLSRALIESRMVEAPVVRFAGDGAFNALPEPARARVIEEWLRDEIDPLLDDLTPERRHVMGTDFARSGDLTVMLPLEIGEKLLRTCPFLVEVRNTPYRQQEQIAARLCDRLPRFGGAAFDARGNGGYLAEAMADRYGSLIEPVMATEAWYREHMPPYKAAFEDGTIRLPRDDDVLTDHRAVRLVRGVPRVPESRERTAGGQRHGDSAIAGALAMYASRRDGGPIEYAAGDPPAAVAAMDEWLGGRPGQGSGRLFGGWL